MTTMAWVDSLLSGQPPSWSEVGAGNRTVLDTCEALEVSALVHDHLTRCGLEHDWPIAICCQLQDRARAAAARELVRIAEVRRVLERLAARQVYPIVFKGAALAHIVYDSPASRPHADVDLLVARDEIETIREVLAAAGYSEPPLSDGEFVFCQFQMTRRDRFGLSHVFDIHWKISTQTLFADVLGYGEIAADSVPLATLGPHARTASGPHALILACIHPVMHHRNFPRLIWLCDIDRLVRRLPATALHRFAAIAVDRRVSQICAGQLHVVAERFGTPLSDDMMAMLTSSSSAEPSMVYLRAGRRWHDELYSNVRGLSAWRDRLQLLREVFLPNTQYMLEAYRLGPRGRVLLPALYIHRCMSGAMKIVLGRK
jgi:putative nucleotidyltransferase-like protein